MPDYSEFPTTPTAWQEHLWPEPEPVPTPEPAPRRPPVDRISLLIGVFFSVLAVVGMAGCPSAGWATARWSGSC